jgi:mono/diheme cytochrome c family protein
MAFVLAVGCQGQQAGEGSMQSTPETAKQSTPETAKPVDRGKYLVAIGGCGDCHTPWKMGANGPEPDMAKMLSGHPQEFTLPPPPDAGNTPWIMSGAATNTAYAGPWGISFAANLTPDMETGFAVWTEEMFVQAMRTGKSKGAGRPIMPPMPWPAYSHMTDEDLKAVFAYLQTIPPIKNKVPDWQPPAGMTGGSPH